MTSQNEAVCHSRDQSIHPVAAQRRGARNERQFLRSGTSLAANYRAACRTRSAADFISKIGIVTEETDERLFWLELLLESGLVQPKLIEPLMSEGDQPLRIFGNRLRPQKRDEGKIPLENL